MPNIVEIVVRGKNESKAGMNDARTGVRTVGEESERTSGKIAGLGSKMAGVGKVMAVGMAAAAIGIGKALYDVGATMDELGDKIRVGTGKSGEALDGLVDSAKKVGTQVPSDFGAVGDAVTILSQRMGLTGKPLEEMSAQFLNLSRITGTELTSNVEQATKVFQSWGVTLADQPQLLDQLFRASQQSGIGIDNLLTSLVSAGPQLRSMGFSLEESVAMLAQFEKAGIDADGVMGSLRIAITKVAKANADSEGSALAVEKAQKSLNDTMAKFPAGSMEVEAAQLKLSEAQDKVKLSTGSARDILKDYIERIKGAADPIEAAGIASDIFGKKANVMADAIRSGRMDFDALLDSITKGTDTINKASLETMDFAEQWQLTKNRLMVAFEPAAAKVFGALGDAMEANGPKIAKVAEDIGPLLVHMLETLLSTIETAAPIIEGVLGALAALGPAAGPVVLGIGGIVGAFKAVDTAKSILDLLPDKFTEVAASAITNFGKMGLSVATHVAASIAGAVATAAAWVVANIAMIAATGGIILIIAAVIAAIVLLVKNWDWVKEKAGELWNWIKGAWDGIKNAVTGAVQSALDWLSENWPLILAILGGPLGLLIKLVVDNWDKIVAFIKAAGPRIGAALLEIGRVMLAIMTGGLSELIILIVRKWDEIVGFFRGLGGRIGDAVGGIISDMSRVGRGIIDGIWNGIVNGWDWLMGKVQDLANSLLDAAMSAIGIGSPSKAFAQKFGAEIPPGAALGVDKNAHVAQEAVRRMSLGMLDQVAKYRTPTATGNGVAMAARAAGNGSGLPERIVLELQAGASRLDELLIEVLSKSIRVRGGDVQVVLGKKVS